MTRPNPIRDLIQVITEKVTLEQLREALDSSLQTNSNLEVLEPFLKNAGLDSAFTTLQEMATQSNGYDVLHAMRSQVRELQGETTHHDTTTQATAPPRVATTSWQLNSGRYSNEAPSPASKTK